MQYAPPTTTHVGLITQTLHLLEQRSLTQSGNAGTASEAQKQLEAELIALRLAIRKVEAKIMGGIQPADWEKLNPDLKHGEELLERVLSFVLSSAWDSPSPAAQEVAECRAKFEVYANNLTATRYIEPIHDGPPTITMLIRRAWSNGAWNNVSVLGATAGAAFLSACSFTQDTDEFGSKLPGALPTHPATLVTGIVITSLLLAAYRRLHQGERYQDVGLVVATGAGACFGYLAGMEMLDVLLRVLPFCALGGLLAGRLVSGAQQRVG